MISQSQSQKIQQQREWFQQLLVNEEKDLACDTDWLQQLRDDARQSIKTFPALNRKQEAWRYNKIDTIFNNSFYPQFNNDLDITTINLKDYLLPSVNSHRLVFINGYWATGLSQLDELPVGVTLSSLAFAMSNNPKQLVRRFEHSYQHNGQIFSALNNALFQDGMYLHIDQSVKLNRPVEIVYINSNQTASALHDGSMIQTRNVIELDKGASATFIEHLVSSNNEQKYFCNNVTDIHLADETRLKHVRLQDESRQAHHLSSLSVTQHKHSHYYSTSVAFGAAWSRTNIKVDFNSEHAECDLHGLYLVGDQQLTDFHLDVRHSVSSCRSREQFKGILYGQGRAVFDGRILVDKQAQHSDAALTNDNLLLVHDAEVYTKPQLEIYADDVKCSHGTTVGRLDPQQLFYLRSRGIDQHDARKMLCQGFAADIVDSIGLTEIHDYVTEKILRTLNSAEINMDDAHGY